MTNPTRILRISPFCGMESANFDRRTLVISKDYEVFQKRNWKIGPNSSTVSENGLFGTEIRQKFRDSGPFHVTPCGLCLRIQYLLEG